MFSQHEVTVTTSLIASPRHTRAKIPRAIMHHRRLTSDQSQPEQKIFSKFQSISIICTSKMHPIKRKLHASFWTLRSPSLYVHTDLSYYSTQARVRASGIVYTAPYSAVASPLWPKPHVGTGESLTQVIISAVSQLWFTEVRWMFCRLSSVVSWQCRSSLLAPQCNYL